jgi:hypothetical protein
LGMLAVAAIAVGLGRLLHRRRPPTAERGDPAAGTVA